MSEQIKMFALIVLIFWEIEKKTINTKCGKYINYILCYHVRSTVETIKIRARKDGSVAMLNRSVRLGLN